MKYLSQIGSDFEFDLSQFEFDSPQFEFDSSQFESKLNQFESKFEFLSPNLSLSLSPDLNLKFEFLRQCLDLRRLNSI